MIMRAWMLPLVLVGLTVFSSVGFAGAEFVLTVPLENTTTSFSCLNETTLLVNTSSTDGTWAAQKVPCEFGCYEGACVERAPDHARFFGFLLLGVAFFFGMMFWFLKNDTLGLAFFILSLGSVMLSAWISAVPLNKASVVSASMSVANMLFWVIVFVLFLVLLRALFNLLSGVWEMMRNRPL